MDLSCDIHGIFMENPWIFLWLENGDLTINYSGDSMDINETMGYIMIYIYTSSTAQGGGGSFKNRKPIGEIGCCESGMAERSH